MVVVAVAGGTGGVGKTIVEQLQRSGQHKPVILGRKSATEIKSDTPPIVVVDYNDSDAMATTLEDLNVDTVISAIGLGSSAASQSQLNLIAAADKSKHTRRFIPSEFTVPIDTSDPESKAAFPFWVQAADALKKTSLIHTRFTNGWFMDYFGLPNIPSNLSNHIWALDISKRRAAIPGTGDEVLTLTYSLDVARFVVRLLDDEAWPEVSYISGSDTTFNKMLQIAEHVIGTKFEVTYDGQERLRDNKATLLSEGYGAGEASQEESEKMVAMFGRMAIEGRILVPKENRLNCRYPDIQPISIEEMIAKAWGS